MLKEENSHDVQSFIRTTEEENHTDLNNKKLSFLSQWEVAQNIFYLLLEYFDNINEGFIEFSLFCAIHHKNKHS